MIFIDEEPQPDNIPENAEQQRRSGSTASEAATMSRKNGIIGSDSFEIISDRLVEVACAKCGARDAAHVVEICGEMIPHVELRSAPSGWFSFRLPPHETERYFCGDCIRSMPREERAKSAPTVVEQLGSSPVGSECIEKRLRAEDPERFERLKSGNWNDGGSG